MSKQFFVYALKRSGTIVYIGSTSNMQARVRTHSATKNFDEVQELSAHAHVADARAIEQDLIREHNPEYNQVRYKSEHGASPRRAPGIRLLNVPIHESLRDALKQAADGVPLATYVRIQLQKHVRKVRAAKRGARR